MCPQNSVSNSILDCLIKKRIAFIYHHTETSLEKVKRDLEDELVKVMDEDDWDGALTRVNYRALCSRLRFKVVYRTYSSVTETCTRCPISPETRRTFVGLDLKINDSTGQLFYSNTWLKL